ncbi:MAG: YIP1 family protein [Bacteroidales bacterium]|nr:YIP1 family protein [Bacteroidales bacterium]
MKTNPGDIFQRAKNIILNPKSEWLVIDNESNSHSHVLSNYLLWLALIPAISVMIGWSSDINFGIKMAIKNFVTIIGGSYLTAWVINELAPRYKGVKNFNKAFELVAYCYTAMCVAGIFYLLNILGSLAFLAGLYSIYTLYVGLQPMMKAPEETNGLYFIVSLVCMIGMSIVLGIILRVAFI